MMTGATPEQKRALAMAATDAKGCLTRISLFDWRKASDSSGGEVVNTPAVYGCIFNQWLSIIGMDAASNSISDVRITPAGAKEALRP